MATASVSRKALGEALRRLSAEAVDVTPDGTPITRAEKLAALLWDRALGHTAKERDGSGNLVDRVHLPEAWALQLVWERLEGKVPVALDVEQNQTVRAIDRVRELAKERINKLASVAAGPPKREVQ